jgi:hypothetical protein
LSWVRMRSESTSALGQPRLTKPIFWVAFDIALTTVNVRETVDYTLGMPYRPRR